MELSIVITIAVPVTIASITGYLHVRQRKTEDKRLEYKQYFKTIRKVANMNGYAESVQLQMASVYELRFYKRYYDVSYRILKGLKDKWSRSNAHTDIVNEVTLTMIYIKMKKYGSSF